MYIERVRQREKSLRKVEPSEEQAGMSLLEKLIARCSDGVEDQGADEEA